MKGARGWRNEVVWIPFLAPAMLLAILLVGIPIFGNLYLSIHRADLSALSGGVMPYVGIQQFIELFQDQSFLSSVQLLLYFALATTALELPIALFVAFYLDQIWNPPKLVQTLLIVPMFVLPVVSGLTFRYLADPLEGPIGVLFPHLGLEAPDILGSTWGAFSLIVVQDVWRMWPFVFMMLYAAMKGLNRDPIEAIKLDGANHWQVFRFVIFPELLPTIIAASLLKGIESLRAFTEIYVMTGGGPGESTSVLSMFIVKQITEFSQFGYGAAASTTLFLWGVAMAGFFAWGQRWQERRDR